MMALCEYLWLLLFTVDHKSSGINKKRRRRDYSLTFGELKQPVLLSSQNTCRITNDNDVIEE
uniref:Uncharacterized protein n=1 Tax=Candidatus Methanogaster sp. ANME-2c ERB4 TaxID=2759911 RepID=A0A7G9YRR6_9EURY|nr:hypothetical protein HLBKPKBF_00018 [Methanosarcinales archaeon ANME-2c ERB4]